MAEIKNLRNESQLSMIKTGGNTNVQAYNVKTQTKFDIGKYVYTLSGHYFLSLYEIVNGAGKTVDVESARNWDLAMKTEKVLNERYNIYSQVQMEGDKFSGYNQRDNYGFGTKYKIIQTKEERFYTEIGYRYSVEHKTTTSENTNPVVISNKGRLYLAYEKQHSKALSYKTGLEYLPNFTDGVDYMVSLDPSFTLLLTNIFSLKFSYKGTYDNSPADENNKIDFKYVSTIIAKY